VVTILLFAGSANAAEKVVVIPLNSSQRTTCTAPDEVLSLGKCWKDRNLGATRVAISVNDTLAYGDLYQWGRLGNGHQNRTSVIETNNSANDVPGHSAFITEDTSPYDWRVPQNDNLWQDIGGINNPCPQDFRLPTEAEFVAEVASWSNKNTAGAFASPLKLPAAGYRLTNNGNILNEGTYGNYWTSTVNGMQVSRLYFYSGNASVINSWRANGYSVRCIKD